MIVYTTSGYAYGKAYGAAEASKVINAQFAGHRETLARMPPIAPVQTFQNLREAIGGDYPVLVYVETSGSHVGSVRARAFHFARQQEKCAAWISCDDDVIASPAAMRVMSYALESNVPTVCTVPYVLRWNQELVPQPIPSVTGVRIDTEVTKDLPVPAHYALFETSGFGCMGVNRAALDLIVEANKGLSFLDVDGEEKLAVTADLLVPTGKESPHCEWLKDDTAFCHRIPAGVRKLAVLVGESTHAGNTLDLFAWAEELRNATH